MNKLGYFAAIIISATAGAGCYFAFGQTILSMIPLLTNITSQIPNVVTYIQENLALIAGTLTVGSAIGLPIIKTIINRSKTNTEQLAAQKIISAESQALQQVSEAEQKLSVATTKNEQLEQQVANLQQANQNVAALQQDKAKLEAQVQTLINEKGELNRALALFVPKKEEKPPIH